MQLQIKARHVEISDAIRDYAETKLRKLERQLKPDTLVEVQLHEEKNPSIAANQIAEASILLKGHVLHAKAAAPDMKAAIDELAEKLHRQVTDQRERGQSWFKRKRRSASQPPA
jgi:putative sigma-54 modulation protein